MRHASFLGSRKPRGIGPAEGDVAPVRRTLQGGHFRIRRLGLFGIRPDIPVDHNVHAAYFQRLEVLSRDGYIDWSRRRRKRNPAGFEHNRLAVFWASSDAVDLALFWARGRWTDA